MPTLSLRFSSIPSFPLSSSVRAGLGEAVFFRSRTKYMFTDFRKVKFFSLMIEAEVKAAGEAVAAVGQGPPYVAPTLRRVRRRFFVMFENPRTRKKGGSRPARTGWHVCSQ